MSSIPESHILCSFEMQSMRVISDDAKRDLMNGTTDVDEIKGRLDPNDLNPPSQTIEWQSRALESTLPN